MDANQKAIPRLRGAESYLRCVDGVYMASIWCVSGAGMVIVKTAFPAKHAKQRQTEERGVPERAFTRTEKPNSFPSWAS
jgi:hypothetical protein